MRNFLENDPAGPITGADSFPGIQGGADVLFSMAALLVAAWDRNSHSGTQPQSSVTGLVAALSAKAADADVVKLTGNQTVAGVKTFSSAPVVPADSWTIAKTAGLQAALDAIPVDGSLVHDTGNETIAGIKTFSSSPVVPTPATGTAAANKDYVDSAITGGSGIRVEDEGSTVVAIASGINFAGSGVTVTDAGSGEATVTVSQTSSPGTAYVATPTGIDHTALVTTARAAAGVGGTVVFPPGYTYIVDGLAASVADQHWVIMAGATVQTKDAADTPTIDVTANGVTIDGGGTIDGNRANQTDTDIGHSGLGTTACVRIISRSNVTVRDITMVDGGSNGVLIDASANVTIEDNRVSGCSPTGNSKQIMVIDVVGNSTKIKIRRNTIDAVSRTNGCISVLAQDAAAVISNLDISDNLCLVGEGGGSVETLGIELFTIATAFITGAVVSGNIVAGPSGVTSTDLIYGISCGGNSSGSTDGNTRVAITGNVVMNCPAMSIEVVGSGVAVSGNSTYNCGPIAVLAVTTTGGVRSVSVTGNSILDSIDVSYCLRIDGDTNGIYGLVVSGNTVRNAAGGYAMLIDGEVSGSIFSGNSFSDLAGPGIGVAGPLVDSIISGNVIDLTGVGGSTADGILLADAGIAGCLISGNIIKDAARTGIYVNAAVDHLSLVGNQVSGCAAYGILATTATNLSIASNDVHGNATADYLTAGSTFTTHVINGAGG